MCALVGALLLCMCGRQLCVRVWCVHAHGRRAAGMSGIVGARFAGSFARAECVCVQRPRTSELPKEDQVPGQRAKHARSRPRFYIRGSRGARAVCVPKHDSHRWQPEECGCSCQPCFCTRGAARPPQWATAETEAGSARPSWFPLTFLRASVRETPEKFRCKVLVCYRAGRLY